MGERFFDAVEREQLSDLLEQLGPEAPTLLEPWTTRDLAAHLVIREHDYLAAPGLVLPGAWARFAERRRAALARKDFSWLVATVRSGPPRGFFRIIWIRRFPNLNEFFVHHEDVRRAHGYGPRENSPRWMRLYGATSFVRRGSSPGVSAVQDSSSSGPGQPRSCGPGEGSPQLGSPDSRVSCCSISSGVRAQHESKSTALPTPSTPSGARTSACSGGSEGLVSIQAAW